MGADKFVLALAAAIMSAGIGAAKATQTIDYGAITFISSDGTLTASDPNAWGSTTYQFSAGQIALTDSTATYVRGLVWCIDITTPVAQSGTYVGSTSAPANLSSSQWSQIAALADYGNQLLPAGLELYQLNGAGFPGATVNLTPQLQQQSEAIQLAIWQVEYGVNNISFTGVSNAVDSFVTTYYDQATYGQLSGIAGAQLLTQAGSQTLVTSVPELSTWAMGLLGLAGLGLLHYRRRSSLNVHAA